MLVANKSSGSCLCRELTMTGTEPLEDFWDEKAVSLLKYYTPSFPQKLKMQSSIENTSHYFCDWFYGMPYWEKSDEKIIIVSNAETPGKFELTEDIINNIVLRVKQSLPIIEPKTQIIERIVETSNNVDLSILDRQQELIDKLSLEIAALKGANKGLDEDMVASLISKQVMITLIQMLGLKAQDGSTVTSDEIKATLLKDSQLYVEEKLAGFQLVVSGDLSKLADEIKGEVKSVKQEFSHSTASSSLHQAAVGVDTGCHCDEMIRKITKDLLMVYDADKTGLVDYALESAGGQVMSTRCTQPYQPNSAVFSLFGIPLWYPSNSPRTVLTPGSSPGDCWAFQGFPGYLVIKLYTRINVSGFSLEHASRLLSPHGQVESAPKKFTVWGLQDEMDKEPVMFGSYEYLNDSTPLQYFPVEEYHQPRADTLPGHDMVELRIESNHGNPVYTCLYRFRVHGDPIEEFSFYGNNPER